METKLTALDVARCILAIADDDDQIDHLKLQKLCYYAQGMHLAIFGTPLFPDTLLRWRHGPVARSVWNAYKYAGSQPLQRPAAEEVPELPGAMQSFLRSVYEEYGQFSSWKLRDMTHQEPPYLEALAAGKQRLSTETMRSYFSGLLAARSGGENSAPPVRSVVRDIVESSPELADAVARGRADFASGAFERLRQLTAPGPFDAYIAQGAALVRDSLSLPQRYRYERALESLLDDPTLSNHYVTQHGEDTYSLIQDDILLYYEFDTTQHHVVRVFALLMSWQSPPLQPEEPAVPSEFAP